MRGRGGGQAQGERRIVRHRGGRGQRDLAVEFDQVGTEVGRDGSTLGVGRATAEEALGRRGGVPQPAPAPDVVGHPGDLAAGRRDREHQLVCVGEPERGGHLVLVLQQQLSCSASAIRWSSTRMSVSSAVASSSDAEVGVVGQERRVGGDARAAR